MVLNVVGSNPISHPQGRNRNVSSFFCYAAHIQNKRESIVMMLSLFCFYSLFITLPLLHDGYHDALEQVPLQPSPAVHLPIPGQS